MVDLASPVQVDGTLMSENEGKSLGASYTWVDTVLLNVLTVSVRDLQRVCFPCTGKLFSCAHPVILRNVFPRTKLACSREERF